MRATLRLWQVKATPQVGTTVSPFTHGDIGGPPGRSIVALQPSVDGWRAMSVGCDTRHADLTGCRVIPTRRPVESTRAALPLLTLSSHSVTAALIGFCAQYLTFLLSTAMHGMQTRSSECLPVCLSECMSVNRQCNHVFQCNLTHWPWPWQCIPVWQGPNLAIVASINCLLSRVAPDLIFSNPAGAGFGRIWDCRSGRGRGRGWRRMFLSWRPRLHYIT